MSTFAAAVVAVANPLSARQSEEPTPGSFDVVPPSPVASTNLEDSAFMATLQSDLPNMVSFATLLEGDLHDDELHDDELHEITSLLAAPSVSDDEDSTGAQIAATAAALDSALDSLHYVESNKKRALEDADHYATASSHKRQVTLEYTNGKNTSAATVIPTSRGITLSSFCGQLTDLEAAATIAGTVTPTTVPSTPVAVAKVAKTTTTTTTKKSTKKTSPKKDAKSSPKEKMSPAEKAKMCRDRNREHARKTRLRKKAYVEELNLQLNQLAAERDALVAAQEHGKVVELENRTVRFSVMEDFLQLRSANELSADRWAAILRDDFVLTMPVTSSFQQMVPTDSVSSGEYQVLTGVEQVMADSAYFAAFLQTLAAHDSSEVAYMVVQCDKASFLMDHCQAVLNFSAESSGTSIAMLMTGSMRAWFNPETNKLVKVHLMLDTGALQAQLKTAQN